ncbi:MAG: hypothetical protein J3Q66DRAFT_167737 [Benniella sp.]|nr:MAG: hypothetical protein J3Q66DRAFT_167737 [Benniella sp.]
MATIPSTSTPGSSTAAAATAGTTSAVGSQQQTETESVTHMQMAGLTVLMIKTKDQVIYKLPDNMSVQSLSTEQREQLLAEINLLHHRQTTAQAIAATQAQTQQVQLAQAQAQAQAQAAQAQGIRQLAPLNQNSSSNSINGGGGGGAGGGGGGVSSASTPVSYRSSPSAPSTPTSITGSDAKTTRRYNKTGKYSKKKFGHGSDRTAETSGTSANGQPYPRIQKPQPAFGSSSSSSQAYPTAQQTSATTVSGITSASAPRQQVIGLSTEDQKRQVKLLQEIHQLQQQVESQQTRLSTFRDQEQTIRRALAVLNNKVVDGRAQELARQNVTTAEKLLETAKAQLREKENVFREQFPVASQQLLLLQQQQLLAAAATAVGSSSGSSSSLNGTSAGLLLSSLASTLAGSGVIPPSVPKTVEEQLQQCIAEHHDSVRNGMAQELQTTHKDLRRPDFRTPFSSLQDAIERLLPFHVFQYPAQDIDSQAKAFANRSEVELNARALSIHKRKYELFNKYHDLLRRSATKATTTNPSSALDIVALRLCLDEERAEHKKVSEQKEFVQNQTKTIREDLESRQVQLLHHQRKTEAALIEHQQRLMLERLRQEEQKQQQQLHMVAQIRQLQQQQQQLQQQQQQQHGALSTEEQELERQHQIELEEQMRKKQEQEEAERRAANTAAAAMAVTAALAGTVGQQPPVLTRTSSTPSSSSSSTPAPNPSSSH